MTTATRASAPRTLASVTLLLTLALATALGVAPARASTSQTTYGDCVKAHNYSDASTGYLFASSERWAHPDGPVCDQVKVEILNGAHPLHPPLYLEGTWCHATVVASASGVDYTSTSATIPYGNWDHPCSNHKAWASGYSSKLGMWFLH